MSRWHPSVAPRAAGVEAAFMLVTATMVADSLDDTRMFVECWQELDSMEQATALGVLVAVIDWLANDLQLAVPSFDRVGWLRQVAARITAEVDR